VSGYLKIITIVVVISCSAAFAAEIPPATDMAALVNGAVISVGDFRSELARVLRLRKKNEQELEPALLAQTKKEALETLIGRELLYQESRREAISIKDADVDAEIVKLRNQFPREEDFDASLGKLNLSRETITRQIRRGMEIQSLIDAKFSSKTAVKENDLQNYYDKHQDAYSQPEQVRLSHILVKSGTMINNTGKSSGRSRIEEIQRMLTQGGDFDLLARQSDDSATTANGGDLGYFTPGQLGKDLEFAAFSLKTGQFSPIVEDRFGYHILKVTERRTAGVRSFDEVREIVSRQLQRERTISELTPYLKRLREAARVEIRLTGEN
jgi:parvulin-like peptidyl-prolyl isomerase